MAETESDYAICKRLEICFMCKKERVEKGHVTCLACRMRRRERDNAHRVLVAEHKNKVCSDIYYRRKAEHKCVKCGAPLPDNWNLVRCETCHDKLTRRDRRRWERKKVEQQARTELRFENGLCYRCGKPALPGFKLCEEHYRTVCGTLEKARESIDRKEHPWRIKQ